LRFGRKRTVRTAFWGIKVFLFQTAIQKEERVVQVNAEEAKTVADALKELNESYSDLLQSMEGTVKEAKNAKHLWRNGEKSKLVKIGLMLLVFPEPTPITETVGAALLTAEAVKRGIRSRAIYVEDVYKTFQRMLKEATLESV